jgi:hypothetical protein
MASNTVLMAGPVRADVSLVKTSKKLSEAKWETRRVVAESAERVPTVDTAAMFEREAAVADLGGAAGVEHRQDLAAQERFIAGAVTAVDELPMGPLAPAADPLPDRVAYAARPHAPGDPHPVIPQTREQSLQRDSVMAGFTRPAPETVVQRGVTLGDRFVDLTEKLKAIDDRAQIDGMQIVGTISSRVPRERIRDSYWISPRAGAADVLRMIYHGLRASDSALAVRWTKRTNQAVGVIIPRGDALLLLELEFAAAMVDAPKAAAVAGVISDREAAAIGMFLDSMAAKRSDLDAVVDERQQMQAELLQAARAGDVGEWQPMAIDQFDAEIAEILETAAR